MRVRNDGISNVLNKIENGRMVLPALQRKFVWSAEKIENLFDSIFKGYPIGVFLSWERTKEELDETEDRYYKFLTKYSEYNDYNNPELSLPYQESKENNDVEVILDGQQRLSSLFIGLKGTFAYKEKGKNKAKLSSYPERELYFNLNPKLSDDNLEDEIKYFKFLTKEEAQKGEWVLVRNIFDSNFIAKLQEKYKGSEDISNMIKNFSDLNIKINSLNLHFDEIEHEKEIDEVLDIFIRVNSGGTPLSKTDLLYSNLTVKWPDARNSVDKLIETIKNDSAFYINSDFVMRAAIYCVSDVVALKVSELKDKAIKIKDNWDKIESSIKNAFLLIHEKWKLNDDDIRAKYSIIPIIYLFYENILSSSFKDDISDDIRIYLIISNIKSIFGGSPDSMLTSLKKCFGKDITNFSINKLFSYKLPGNRDFKIDEDFINNDILAKQKGADARLILSLLYSDYDKQLSLHQDHMHPETICKSDKKIKENTKNLSETQIEFIKKYYNSIPNLQLLEGTINESKNKKPLESWINEQFKNDPSGKKDYLNRNFVDDNINLDLSNFKEFFDNRKNNMSKKLKKIFKI